MNLLGDYRYVSPKELTALGNLQQPQPLTSEAIAKAGLASWHRQMQQVSQAQLCLCHDHVMYSSTLNTS